MLRLIVGLDTAKIAKEDKYSPLKLIGGLHKLCLYSGFYLLDNGIYTCIRETKDEERGCLHRMMANLLANLPIFENLEFFVVKDGISTYTDFLEEMTAAIHDASVRAKEEVYPIRKSDVSRLVSKDHWKE